MGRGGSSGSYPLFALKCRRRISRLKEIGERHVKSSELVKELIECMPDIPSQYVVFKPLKNAADKDFK
jgi:hypothetical protein